MYISVPSLLDRALFVISFGITYVRTPYGYWGGDIRRNNYQKMEGLMPFQ